MNQRFFVEKKSGFDLEAHRLLVQFRDVLGVNGLEMVRLINGYEVFNLTATHQELHQIKHHILSEPVTDDICESLDLSEQVYFAVSYLPGQFDQRADSAKQCIELLCKHTSHLHVLSFKVIVLMGHLSLEDIQKIKTFYINPIEMQEKDLSVFELKDIFVQNSVPIITGFCELNKVDLECLRATWDLSLSLEDLQFIQSHYQSLQRDPTETELKVFDTYWSDHCRHTTFETVIDRVSFPESSFGEMIQSSFEHYLNLKKVASPNKPMSLMDMGTVMGKYLRKTGCLADLEVSDENNACSVFVDVDVTDFDGKTSVEKWLLMFKNETHNHPTEIEPFGGASTCLGGAIRDPLSGRSYVYQAIRVTGAANPLEPIEKTLTGKLSQRKITQDAAHGYSSYGNQIGVATTLVSEIYHEGYKAKRMEVGAVVAATPAEHVVRQRPVAGDQIILLGGKTGRDGCGGASGSSKTHNKDSLLLCGAQVQKGNAVEERKIQRFFRKKEISQLIKKCNDFGAGGVCVAIGELSDGVCVDLDKVPVKYEGLSGTELAISESQERMAVIVSADHVFDFLEGAKEENLLATVVGEVTNENRLILKWQGQEIVNICRDFLNTNGVSQSIDIQVEDLVSDVLLSDSSVDYCIVDDINKPLSQRWISQMGALNVASQKGLVEMFDATVGAGTVLMPFGGRDQMTPIQTSIAKLPVLNKDTTTVSGITWGFDPVLSAWSTYHGGMYAVLNSLSKLVASGLSYKKAHLSFQEYFQRLGRNPKVWSKPFLALLGAIRAQSDFGVAAIGGKDSMSGSFDELHVPPTLISFAVSTGHIDQVISPEFKHTSSYVYLFETKLDQQGLYDPKYVISMWDELLHEIHIGHICSAMVIEQGGVAATISKMSFGNQVGVDLSDMPHDFDWFSSKVGSIVVETVKPLSSHFAQYLGRTQSIFEVKLPHGERLDLRHVQQQWLSTLSPIFPYTTDHQQDTQLLKEPMGGYLDVTPPVPHTKSLSSKHAFAKPRVLIATFPGTNSEYDMYHAFNRQGADANMLLFKNTQIHDIQNSVSAMVDSLNNSQIFVLPGGFSVGDEPDGSGKFIAAILQNPYLQEAFYEFLNRDGLVLGICNGFQALIKSGLLSVGTTKGVSEQSPTLTFNKIGRHASQIVRTRIVNNHSPWLSSFEKNQVFHVPISHGEGRFYASPEVLEQLWLNGQIATQYVDEKGQPTQSFLDNPNGSSWAIEGITSLDGRILGKMGHSERYSHGVFKNIEGCKDQAIFLNGVRYFTD